MTWNYEHCIEVRPASNDEWVAEGNNATGGLGDWHAINRLVADFPTHDVRTVHGMIAVRTDYLEAVVAKIEQRGWDYDVHGSCRYRTGGEGDAITDVSYIGE